jgi:hypothetical protein
MSMSLRTILSAVMGESGFVIPTSFVGSTSPDDLQMVYLANRAANAIREAGFEKLVKRNTTTLTTATTYALPDDFLEIVPDTMRIVGRIDVANFPAQADWWSYLQSMAGPVGIPVNVRLINGLLNVYSPTENDVIAYEYISNMPITDSTGATPKASFTADEDLWLLDDDLLILEVRWRYLQAKGLPDWQLVAQECKNYRNSVKGRDAGSQTLTHGSIDPTAFEPYTPLWVA